MKRNIERTSKVVASKAAKALRDPTASKREKSVAASALTQREVSKNFSGSMNDVLSRIGDYCQKNGIRPLDVARMFNAGLAAHNALRRK